MSQVTAFNSSTFTIADSDHCEVLFPYRSVNEDELDLQPGQVIKIISRDLEDPGWWRGSYNGKVGVFPDNFVKSISSPSSAAGSGGTKPVPKMTGSVEEKYDLNSLKNELDSRFVLLSTFCYLLIPPYSKLITIVISRIQQQKTLERQMVWQR